MNVRFAPRLLAAALLSTAVTTPALAQEAGDWLFRVGVGYIATDTSNDELSFEGTTLQNFRAEVDDGVSAVFNLSYFLNPNWALELLASAPVKHDINGKGALASLDTLGRTYHLPPTLSLQYHFAPGAKFRPYVGAGINYTLFFNDKLKPSTHDALVATANDALGTSFAGGRSSLDIDDSFGAAFQVGVDMQVSEKWFTNLDLRYILIDADADIQTTTFDAAGTPTVFNSNFDLSIDPWVLSWTVGFKF